MEAANHVGDRELIITLCQRAISFFNLGGMNVNLAVLVIREINSLIKKDYSNEEVAIPEDIIQHVNAVNITAMQQGHPIRITWE